MADISKLAQVINGLVRNQSLDTNTLVVSNLKIKLGTGFHYTFTGTPTANRNIILPDADVDLSMLTGGSFIKADGSVAFTGNQSMGGFRLTNLGTPIAASDAVPKSYVDSALEGLKPKEAVRVATTGNITLSGLQTIDGVALSAGDRVLVKDQTNQAENGIYVVSASTWSRAADFDQLTPINEIKGAYVAVIEGTQNQGKLFVCASNPNTLGTDPIVFTFFNSVSTLVAGNGIDITGNTVAVKLKTSGAGSGLTFTAGELHANPDDVTIELDSNQLQVKDSGITAAKLATDSVTTAKIQDDAVTTNKIANDSVTTAKIQDSAVTSLKLADDSVTSSKIQDNAVTTSKLANDSVSTSKIQDAAVITTKLANDSVTTAKIQDDAVTTNKIANNAITAAKIDSTAVDGGTITGGGGTALSAVRTFRITLPSSLRVAGESFAAGLHVVRWGKNSLSETAGQLYKADNDVSSTDKYEAIGFIRPTAALNSGDPISISQIVLYGVFNLPNNEFATADIGKTIYLGANGAYTLTAPTATDTAVVELGVVIDVNAIWVKSPVLRGIN